jgi:cyclic pyranopterin phosphate synthase
MPIGDTGRAVSAGYVDLREVRRRLAGKFDLIPATMPGGGPARYVQVAGTNLRIGFITPVSRHFCETCNRVRLSADGTIFTCLGQEHAVPLRPLLRGGAGVDELRNAIQRAIRDKPERHDFTSHPERIVRFMSATGG